MSNEAPRERHSPSERSKVGPFSWWYVVEVVAAAAGLALSIYLAVQHTRLKLGIQGGPSFCSLGQHFDCDAVNSSTFSEIAGVPIALAGAFYYLAALVLVLVALPGRRGFAGAQRWVGRLVVLALAVDLGLLVVQLFVLKNLCPLCSATYLCTTALLVAAVQLTDGASFRDRLARLLWRGLAPLPGVGALAAGALGFAVTATLLLFVPDVRAPKEDASQSAEIEQWFAEFERLPTKRLPETPEDGVSGPADAAHQLVVFSDFQCPFCKRAAETLDKALKPYRDRVRFVFKHFPLDSSCNPALSYPLHPHACYLAAQGICAQRAGKFQQFHDTVFSRLDEETFLEGRDAINRVLDTVVDEASRRRCDEDLSVQAAIRTSIELGRELGVKGTPAFFLDGRPVAVLVNEQTLRRLLGLAKRH